MQNEQETECIGQCLARSKYLRRGRGAPSQPANTSQAPSGCQACVLALRVQPGSPGCLQKAHRRLRGWGDRQSEQRRREEEGGWAQNTPGSMWHWVRDRRVQPNGPGSCNGSMQTVMGSNFCVPSAAAVGCGSGAGRGSIRRLWPSSRQRVPGGRGDGGETRHQQAQFHAGSLGRLLPREKTKGSTDSSPFHTQQHWTERGHF